MNQFTLQELLQNYFSQLNQIEYDAQQMKCQICNDQQFEAYSYWNYLTDGKMVMNMNTLKEQFPNLTTMSLALIFLFFDNNLDGQLNYEDFFQLVVPTNNQLIRQEVTFRQVNLQNSRQMKLNVKIQELLQFYGESLKQLQKIKQQIQQHSMFNVYLSYQQISNNKQIQRILHLDQYAYFLITKEINLLEQNQLKFIYFYKLFSVYEDNPINELFIFINKNPFVAAEKVFNDLNNNKKLNKTFSQFSATKFEKNNDKKQRNIQYFSVQTNPLNQSKITESIVTSQWNV